MNVLEYRFAITPVFHFIAAKSMEAGLYLCGGYAKQTVQLWLKDPTVENGKRRIGAIQYEGSNDYTVKEPSMVSWRFERALLPDGLKQELEATSAFRRDRNDGPPVNPSAQSIAFKFETLTDAAKETIERIAAVLQRYA
ncbi:hypothetical protein GS3922_00400 [Geobacillus subterraneus]|uniref:Uncharacterized protein n=2 Tax=Geobacillus TaxID=129337 RepID=A0ABM6AFK6_9BACL|nr:MULTISPECIES: hypothetical protein [Geobacillus]AMX85162.1 hypothetical protein GS3922_00400 [Geobacillus subterraneus]KZS24535.1 hypothetical protein A5418_00745 [Geobacillus subterraneus]OXB91530.1 hypothetical protein B9L21_00230 [Geobacillus uzenensis]WPZ18128.1 hypothetical protein UM396_16490 [Geobacillus subterraneus]